MSTKADVLKALMCLRLEAPEVVVDDVERIVLGHIGKLEEALIWCSGSADFGPNGQAREGWIKLCAPLLEGLCATSAPTKEEP